MFNYRIFDSLSIKGPYISAQELARTVGATKSQILYWGKAKYLERRTDEYHMFPIQTIAKAKLMSILVNEVGMMPKRSSSLADKLLRRLDSSLDAVETILCFLTLLYECTNQIIDFVASDDDLRNMVRKLRVGD